MVERDQVHPLPFQLLLDEHPRLLPVEEEAVEVSPDRDNVADRLPAETFPDGVKFDLIDVKEVKAAVGRRLQDLELRFVAGAEGEGRQAFLERVGLIEGP